MKLSILILASTLMLSSCNYLDIIPDERNKIEDAYNTPKRVESFLYSCYSYLPQRSNLTTTFDRGSGVEFSIYEKGDFALFPKGLYSPVTPQMATNEWSPIWQGVRQCYLFLSILDKVDCIDSELVKQYRAEANLLIAYYHFQSMRAFGPTLIIDHVYSQDVATEGLPERSSTDEVARFINEKIDEAMPDLPEEQTGSYLGRVCRQMARALRSRMTLMLASPLFNPRPEDPTKNMYASTLRSPLDNRQLIPITFDIKKWEIARDAAWNAIDEAHKLGYALYDVGDVGAPIATKPGFSADNNNQFSRKQRALRYVGLDILNDKEGLFYETRPETNAAWYGIIGRSLPRQSVQPWGDGKNTIATTLQTVERFYTKNGLPIDKDKTFDYKNRYQTITVNTNALDKNDYPNRSITTIKLHQNREPRFYAFVGFHGGNCEIANYNNAATSTNFSQMVIPGGLKMLFNQVQGWNGTATVDYSVTGYLNKRFFHPGTQRTLIQAPFPIFRLAELYLNYAEALIEIGGETNLNMAKVYIDKIRARAGIIGVDEAWNDFSSDKGYQNTQEGMREIVRTERQLEFYMEGHRVWDIRRWKLAEQEFNRRDLGWNIRATGEAAFYAKPMEMANPRAFHKGQYLLPINTDEINKTPQVIQNPYY